MGIEVSWHDREKTILVWRISGTITHVDYRQASRVSRALHDSVTHGVITVFDVRQVNRIPDDIIEIFPTAVADVPNNRHMAVALGASGKLRKLIQVFSRVYIKVTLVGSMDEVYSLTDNYRQQIIGGAAD